MINFTYSATVQSFNLIRYEHKKFQLKLFDTAETLKYNQGQWKWYEWVKLNEYYHYAKFVLYHIYSVRENRNINIFATHGYSAGRPNTDHYINPHFFTCQKFAFQQKEKGEDIIRRPSLQNSTALKKERKKERKKRGQKTQTSWQTSIAKEDPVCEPRRD